MQSLFEKLNLKDIKEIVVLNPPPSFELVLTSLTGVKVHRKTPPEAVVRFALVFAKTQREVDDATDALMTKLEADALLWFCYPKQSSKTLRCEFNRDNGWEVLGRGGYEPVRQVSIDEDWSALRFRRVEFIKKLTRNPAMAISQAGKTRARAPG